MNLNQIEKTKLIYDVKEFRPEKYTLTSLKKMCPKISDEYLCRAVTASKDFYKKFHDRTLFPKPCFTTEQIDINSEPEVHNYTGACPVQTYEINPVKGCSIGCLYCLVNDGIHTDPVCYDNYHLLVKRILEREKDTSHFYYFSPKTEAFSEAALRTGTAHKILNVFIDHFSRYPESKARIFIASKAGISQLDYKFEGETILDLFAQLKDKMQFNTSLSIFPGNARELLEPYAASTESRLLAVQRCREIGITANSALVQPILINCLNEKNITDFILMLKSCGIINLKPEFLTVSIENMVMIAQILKLSDPGIEKELFNCYYTNQNISHIKQRKRTAPLRELSLKFIKKIHEIAAVHGISVSICNWVRNELLISEDFIPVINENGFQCLGYQTGLFDK